LPVLFLTPFFYYLEINNKLKCELLSGSSTPIKTKYELQQVTGDIENSYQMGRAVAGCWSLDTRYWILDAGYWMLDARCWMLDTGCWMLNFGYQFLVAISF
jgi:hypothetical protein